MLHVVRLTGRAGAYYLADLASELGPARDAARGSGTDLEVGRPGWWTGAGAGGLGLEGTVEAPDLEAVLSGQNPATGRSLVARRGVVSGYDLTFTAPKSASVLFALGSHEIAGEVLSAHTKAVEGAMGYVARRAMAVRRRAGEERSSEPVGGVVGARFTHGVSRALDPHLHTHVVVANLGHGPDGRWTAIDGRGLFAHARAAGNLYGAELRHRLSAALGVQWTMRLGGSYEVACIDPAVIGGFSSRGAEIRSYLAERSPRQSGDGGAPGARIGARLGQSAPRRASRVAWAATRDAKAPPLGPWELARRWSAQASELGLFTEDLRVALTRSTVPAKETCTVDEHRFAGHLLVSPHVTATRRDVVHAWTGALAQGAPAADVECCVDQLAAWAGGVGVAEVPLPIATVIPASHQLRALGSRPGSPRALGVWLGAAAAITEYRTRWGVADPARALGVEGSGRELATMGARRLAEHLDTTRRVGDARRRLGRTVARDATYPHLSLGRE